MAYPAAIHSTTAYMLVVNTIPNVSIIGRIVAIPIAIKTARNPL